MKRYIISMIAVIVLMFALTGCTAEGDVIKMDSESVRDNSAPNTVGQSESVSSESDDRDYSSRQSYTEGELASDDFMDPLDQLESSVIEEIENRKNATPIHAALGEEVMATKNLAVSVLSVEPGPYDYADNTPTVKVTVRLRNLTDKTIVVKASNFDADNSNGQRVDHKLYIKDESGRRDVRSFEPTKVSPNATFAGIVFFDGEGLKSVIYEPHWLVR